MALQIRIIRLKRRTLSLRVLPDETVEVKAPNFMPMFMINRFVEKNREWIEKRIEKLKSRPKVLKREYKDGEEFFYLGKPYKLKMGNYSEIEVKGGFLLFPKALEFRIRKELTDWYIKKAREVITKRVEENAKEMGVRYVSIGFSDTKSKWGSCSHDNRLQFNWRLVMTPLIVLNYVTVHELAHTVEKNHSINFWNKVRTLNPSWRQQRKWLKDYGDSLIM